MTRILALALSALLLVAIPVSADDPELLTPCTNTSGVAGTITVDGGFSVDVETPVEPLFVGSTDAGVYQVDLAGLPVGSTRKVDFSLSWTNGVLDDFSDYDLEINGSGNAEPGSGPETLSFTASHCKKYTATAINFMGTPADSLTLTGAFSFFQ